MRKVSCNSFVSMEIVAKVEQITEEPHTFWLISLEHKDHLKASIQRHDYNSGC